MHAAAELQHIARTNMLRVGLIGAGRIGKVHAASITQHKGSHLVSVADVVAENAFALATEYDINTDSADGIIEDPSIHAVLIASSTDTHCDLIEAAAAAGKAVLCEKPVDLSLERAEICLERVSSATAPVMIGFNRRFDNNFATLEAAVIAGEIGKTEMLSITSLDPAPPPIDYIRVSGGLFRDMMIHDFDMANFLMKDLPETVSATGSCLVNPAIAAEGDVDTAVATLSYSDGKIAVIKNSRRAAYGYDQRLELFGSDGALRVENVNESSVVKSTADGISSAKPLYFFLERYMPAYSAVWSSFVTAIELGTEVPVTLRDGVNALAISEAAAQSCRTGQPVALKDVL